MTEVELPNPEDLEEIKGKAFTRRVALITAIYAVMLAITSLGGGNAMKEMLLAQQQVSDQWAYYQAKAVREHLYRAERVQLELTLLTGADTMKPEARSALEGALKNMAEEEDRFRREKKDIEQVAKKLEAERDVNRSKDPYFDYAEVLLQIAIVMASISILAVSPRIFQFSLAMAVLGPILCTNGFLLFFRIPFLH
ncbi:MAG: DUF4337 domain-containing protein [Syntrophobacteraceae bacterium]|nr:DUF4337 domain-containing protein [Desulfobacteraceae bacterium]